MPKIKGGYILQPRAIDQSSIAKSPPHVREIWMYILRRANHADCPEQRLRRGQLRTSYREILADLSWTVGYRKESYKKTQCEIAMRVLTREGMITTAKSTRGMVITVCKYDYYQNPNHYVVDKVVDNEVDNEIDNESTGNTRRIKKNKEVKNNTPIFSKEKTIATPVKILHVDVEEVYKKYPTKCLIRGASTGKGAKDKTKIKALLKQYSKNELLETIELYVNDCVATNTYMKNFSTFLNNLPSMESFEGSNSNYINNKKNGNNQITAKERQRQQVAVDVGQGILQRFYDEQNQQNDL